MRITLDIPEVQFDRYEQYYKPYLANSWISVKDCLPDNSAQKVLHTDGKSTGIGFYTGASKGSDWWDITGDDPIVTHWQPLPEPPSL